MDINTCLYTTGEYRPLAYYSHLLPIAIALFLSAFAVLRSRFSLLAVAFFLFCGAFSLWLVGDLVTWVSNDYHWVQAFWSWLDYVSILYFVLGAIFFALLLRGRIRLVEMLFFLALLAIPFWWTVSGQSVSDFNFADCEVQENILLTEFKFIAHALTLGYILISFVLFFRKSAVAERARAGVMLFGMVLFLGTASITEYISSTTYIYEVNLYGLLVLPISLIVFVFTITNLGLFQFRLLGSQILAYVLILTVGSQFMFLQNTTERVLSAATLAISLCIAILFLLNSNKELKARKHIEELAQELNRSNERLRELDTAKSEFISIASHQLRTPLTAIKGYVSLLLEGSYGKVPAPVQDVLNKVYSVNERLTQLVEDLLNISRIEAGRIQYRFEPTQIEVLVADLVDSFKVTPKAEHLDLRLRLPKNSLPKVTVDGHKIREVVSNLIDNALKYTKEGSVTVSVEGQPDAVRISIQDTGIGIAPEVKERLFEKFVRSQETSRMEVGGVGLGLYVGKSFIAAHGGRLWAESEGQGKGATFFVELPFENPHALGGSARKETAAS